MPDRPNPDRDDLVARLDLMETMIAEGRTTTARYGWVFVMWGLLYCAATAWGSLLPYRAFAWPVCVVIGVLTSVLNARRQRLAGGAESPRSRSVGAVWQAMGIGVSLFAFTCAFTHHIESPVALSGLMFIVGLAHGTSALILRWTAQGLAAAVWWIGGMAALVFTAPAQLLTIFLLATLFGMVLFGLYMMMIERRRVPPPAVPKHA